ncbi:hypothetical protein IFM89_008182 [Coptis chinensis]|uniref:Serine hydrolase domain-containing protein n=1 Tax=Coptis chinensis TaxID=261450 RepID=A0A835LX38_9MAGN|nr:hypothetical protein IFM89_008182 [Coptis chinensis]
MTTALCYSHSVYKFSPNTSHSPTQPEFQFLRKKLLQKNNNNNMGDLGTSEPKPKFLCLHGFRTSGEIMKKQIGKWPASVLDKLDLVFLDAPFPCGGKSDVEGIFDPPYYEWFQFEKDFMEYRNLDKCLEYIEESMLKLGPFDGLVGFSQGAILSGALLGMQSKGVALTKVPKIKFLIVISGAMFKTQALIEESYASQIKFPSLHFLGEADFLRPYGTKLLEYFVDPFVIHHPKGHTVPRLDEKSLEIMNSFLEKIQNTLSCEDGLTNGEEEKEEAVL